VVEANSNLREEGEFMKYKVKKKKVTKNEMDKKPSKLKKLQILFKNWLEEEKQKNEIRKQEINRSVKPKGFLARKLGIITFWILFLFMFLVIIVTIFSGNDEVTAGKDIEIEINQATTPEAIQFAENFLKDYFTWTLSEEGQEKREQAMVKYVAEELRDHSSFALDLKNMTWNSKYIKSEIKNIEEKGEHLAYLTFLVEFEFTKASEGKDQPETKRLQKYIDVPVAHDGYSYGIFDLPKFTFLNEDETTIKSVGMERLDQADVSIANKINEFLPTFFKTYAEDEKEKLDYMLKNPDITEGLNGTMLFDSITNIQAFNKEKNENEITEFIVFVEVKLIEPETKMPFLVNHQLELVIEDDRLLVSGMNNHEYKEVITNSAEKFSNDETVDSLKKLEIEKE
jgi:hypothetical protein